MYFATSTLTSITAMIPGLFTAGCIRKKPGKIRQKTHYYTRYDAGVDYIFEPAIADGLGYLTTQGGRVKRGDCIVLCDKANPHWYQVEEIDYYANPSDMWIAALKPIGNRAKER